MQFQVAGLDKFPSISAAIRHADKHNYTSVSFSTGKETVRICKDVFGVWRMSKENK